MTTTQTRRDVRDTRLITLAVGGLLTACGGVTGPSATANKPVVVSGAGDIGAVVERYRGLLGPDNGGEPGGKPSGRREINWDKVQDDQAAPNILPGGLFQRGAGPPRARRATCHTRSGCPG